MRHTTVLIERQIIKDDNVKIMFNAILYRVATIAIVRRNTGTENHWKSWFWY